MQSRTYDANGEVTETSQSTNNLTVSFAKKLGRENFGNEELFISMQVEVDPDADLVAIEGQAKGAYAFLRSIVYEQFGLETTTSDDGVVQDVPQPEKPKGNSKFPKKGGSDKGAPKAEATGSDKDALWLELAEAVSKYEAGDTERIEGFFDNRPKIESGEYSEKSPEFKHIKSGTGFWLNKPEQIPAAARLVLCP